MDEIVVRIARAIASRPRLRLLSCMAQSTETAPTELARTQKMSIGLASAHLRTLSMAGLIQRRRSGVWCYCSADSPYSEDAISGRVMAWLRPVLKGPTKAAHDYGLVQVRDCSVGDAERSLHDAIYDAATAFTCVRRIQILRRLTRGDAVGVSALTSELSMSDAAVSRHMSKLTRRGFVTSTPSGHSLAYGLAAEFKTPVHAKLFEMVSTDWQE